MLFFASPARVHKTIGFLLPISSVAAAVLLLWGFVWAFGVPPDAQHGEMVRLLFIHVPAAWTALGAYIFLAGASGVALVWRHPLAACAGRAAAVPGACFAFLTLLSGALWGRPIWGVWWVWDARLGSMLVLFLLFLGYCALWLSIESPHRAAKMASVFALVGVVNVPIVKFSVDWWATLHQPASLLRTGGPAIDSVFLKPLLVMSGGFLMFFLVIFFVRLQALSLAQRRYRLFVQQGG